MPPGGIPKGGLRTAAAAAAAWGSKGGRGNPFSNPKPPGPGPIGPPGKPGIPKGGPGRPPCFKAAAAAAAADAADAPAAEAVGVGGGLGVVGFSPPDSEDSLPEGAGVDEAEDLPLLGLTGSFLALRSPFSLGGVRLSPLVIACVAALEGCCSY